MLKTLPLSIACLAIFALPELHRTADLWNDLATTLARAFGAH